MEHHIFFYQALQLVSIASLILGFIAVPAGTLMLFTILDSSLNYMRNRIIAVALTNLTLGSSFVTLGLLLAYFVK